VVDLDQVPISPRAYALAERTGVFEADWPEDVVRHALGSGEDFELLLAVPPGAADAIVNDQPVGCGITCIGELMDERGLWHLLKDGTRLPLEATGWQH
jgi:thiamine monophosphate kinase